MMDEPRTNHKPAVIEYLRREQKANAGMRGADVRRIMADVAKEYGLPVEVLADAVLDSSFSAAV